MVIPEKINRFNIYGDSGKYAGVSGEITLPDFEAVTNTLATAGIMGEIESVNDGHFGSQEITIPFVTFSEEAATLFEPGFHIITLRAAQESTDTSMRQIFHRKLKVVVSGRSKGLKSGKMKAGEGTATEVTLEIYYIKITEEGKTLIELSKTDDIFVVNGKDYYKEIRDCI